MDKPVSPSEISSWWAILVSLVLGLVSLGVFKAKVATKADLQKSEVDMLKRLYREDGTTIYTPRIECEKNQAGCANRVCEKIEESKADVHHWHKEIREEISGWREEQREHSKLHSELAEFVGAVKNFIDHHRREGDLK